MKTLILIFSSIFLFSCTNKEKKSTSENLLNDTIVSKKIYKVTDDTAFSVQILKRGEYNVLLKHKKTAFLYERQFFLKECF